MSKERNDGGPAFPRSGDQVSVTPQDGMSLRDWLAGMALQGHRANSDPRLRDVAPSIVASWSYADADAMLKVREEKGVQ